MMADIHVNLENSGNPTQTTSLCGYIHYENKGNNVYARHCKSSCTKNGKIYHEEDYLGKVIDKSIGLFQNRERGIFTFSIENGYGEPNPLDIPLVYEKPFHKTLHFGDVWMVDQILKQTGLVDILESLVTNAGDTIKSLVSFRTIESVAYSYAEDWYLKSYARVLYPNAKLESSMISQFHTLLGQEDVYINFFKQYLTMVTKNKNISYQISIPILIDSTGLPNDIKTHLTAINNHNGVISNEIRLIYVVDKRTNLPIYFRYIPGNIIDNSTLITTINLLKANNIDIEIVIMDAGYSSLSNLEQLIRANIPFVTRLIRNRTDYKELIGTYGQNLRSAKNAITYGERSLYGQKVDYNLFGKNIYAYIMLDINKQSEDENYIIQKYKEDNDRLSKIDEKLPFAGKFVILSSENYNIDEILPLYYSRQMIEQVFDISKNFTDIIPLRGHSEETIRARLLISFISTIIYSSINFGLKDSKLCAHKAIYKLKNLLIKIYEDINILEELDKSQKEIFKTLHLDCPFSEEKGNLLKNKSFLDLNNINDSPKRKGRPKGSKNLMKKEKSFKVSLVPDSTDTDTLKRTRGRPKGSKNKKIVNVNSIIVNDINT
jgi:transposase